MKTILHKANTRGHANHGWLNSYHTFSFANYYNPQRMNFGALRVLNDDAIDGGTGFGKHPHDNMEIISIALEGDLEHEDSMGNKKVIRQGDIQAMTAGTGVFHSEYNKNKDRPAKFLQIWVLPEKRNVPPSYDQISLNENDLKNQLHQIVSPQEADDGVKINQQAWFHLGNLDKGTQLEYVLKGKNNGVYAFVIDGEVIINKEALTKRDGLGISETETLQIEAKADAQLLLMEVPMQL
jgi:redox-sensitive bicupin YhaK (pirin superfamily)